jgi:hypothetical protein
MTFQFLCPQGHLLQGEEAHMGMQCQCPQCGTAFIIPTIESAPSPAATSSAADLGLAPFDDTDLLTGPANPSRTYESAPSGLEGFAAGGFESQDPGSAGLAADEGVGELSDEVGEVLLHIPCPNGHVLDVPLEMIGARAMCPHCRAEFRLRREKSEEYLREQEILDAKRAQFWFKLAIIAAGVVVIVLLVMILAASLT